MSDSTRKIAIFVCLLLTSFCFWKAGTGLIDGADGSMLPSAQAALSPAVTPPRVVTTPIQEMRPGMRVVGRNPLRIQTESTIDPTPEGWRLLSVRMRKPDGSYFEADLLRPLSWIRRHRAQPGAVIELNMPELHVVGAAEVLSISACPPIDRGDGSVVLSTFKNVANNILNIYVEGETEPIGVTAGHPIWSEDRQTFVHSDQLQPGERLRSALGKTVRITSIEIRAGPEPVYNLEVAGEHVYSVTNSGLLVHNTGDCNLETFYRTLSKEHYDEFVQTGKIPATRETFTSPTQSFSESYDGVLLEIKVASGTTDALKQIGVRDSSRVVRDAGLGYLEEVSSGWTTNNAFFKGEGSQVNIGLGKGKALEVFNNNIVKYDVIRGP